jgi:hypothetical protein
MAKIISLISLILLLIFSPPAALAYISQDAIPGEPTYPIKRVLEDGILFFASLHPYTKAVFAVAQSNRRFEESAGLLKKQAPATQTLQELVSQTDQAAKDINKLQDQKQKKEVAQKLASSIDKYNQTLEQQSTKNSSASSTSDLANNDQRSVKTISNKSQAIVLPKSSTTNPTQQNQQINQQLSQQQKELEETRKSLDEIKRQLQALVDSQISVQASTPSPTARPSSTQNPIHQAAQSIQTVTTASPLPTDTPTVVPNSPAFQNAINMSDSVPSSSPSPEITSSPSQPPESISPEPSLTPNPSP